MRSGNQNVALRESLPHFRLPWSTRVESERFSTPLRWPSDSFLNLGGRGNRSTPLCGRRPTLRGGAGISGAAMVHRCRVACSRAAATTHTAFACESTYRSDPTTRSGGELHSPQRGCGWRTLVDHESPCSRHAVRSHTSPSRSRNRATKSPSHQSRSTRDPTILSAWIRHDTT